MDTLQDKEIVTKALSRQELVSQLRHLGVKDDMSLEVHCSLKQIGYVIGGAQSVVDALMETLPQGNLIMSSQNGDNSEPLNWTDPPIDLRLAEKVRENMPAYDIYSSNIHAMGAVAENLRNRKGCCHSYHPNCAFMAWGKDARNLMAFQPLNFPFGVRSPLDKLYMMENSWILLIGTDYDTATGLHYGETMSEVRPIVLNGGAVNKDGKTVWKKYLEIEYHSEEFPEIGRQMERNKMVKTGKIGNATARLFNFKAANDFAISYLISKYGGK